MPTNRMLLCASSIAITLPVLAESSLLTQIQRDTTALPMAGQVQLSYAKAVGAVRDSVVSLRVTLKRTPEAEARRVRERRAERRQEELDLFPPQSGGAGSLDDDADAEDSVSQRGSGLIITQDGLVLTNHLVIDQAESVLITLRGQDQPVPAVVVGADEATDIALLRVAPAAAGAYPAARLGDSATLQQGDVVLAMGSPYGLDQTVTMGIISATGRAEVGIIRSGQEDFIQTDAAINPGNSGGPLVDGLGRAVGINTGRWWGESIGFAVPINQALKVAADLLEHGLVVRGHLGVRLADLTPERGRQLGLPSRTRGVVVREVEADQPGAAVGLRPADVITAVNDQSCESSARFRLRMANQAPGAKTRLSVLRGGERFVLTATLVEPPEVKTMRQAKDKALATAAASAAAAAKAGLEAGELLPGLMVAALTPEQAEARGLQPAVGLLVTADYVEGQGKVVRVKEGDIITSANGDTLRTLGQARDRLKAATGSTLMLRIRRADAPVFVALPLPPKTSH